MGDIGDDDVVSFILRWNLNDDAQAKLMKLSPAAREHVVNEFNAPEGMTEVNGRLIKFANTIDKQFGGGSGGGVAKHGSSEDELVNFSAQWNLNEDAQNKLRKLSPHVQTIVMNSFNPKAPEEHVNGKFIMFASSVEKAQAHAADQDPVIGFIRHWNLNEDAQNKMSKLSPHVQSIVMEQFNPKAPQEQVNGKFIMFASSIEKAQGQASHQHHRVEEDPLFAFIRHWNLNEDAQAKLSQLSPHVQSIVINSFDPPAHLTEVNGKLIMFATSVEKAQGQQEFPTSNHSAQAAKGFGIVGQKGFGKAMSKDGWAAWPQYEDPSWAPGVGQKRSWSQSQMSGWSPPGKQHMGPAMHNSHHVDPGYDPSYDVQLPPAIDEYALIGFVHQWGLNDDAVNKLKKLSPPVRLKVLNEFKPAGEPQEGKGWSGKLIAFATQLEKYSR